MDEGGWNAVTYLDEVRLEIPRYAELQDAVAAATRSLDVRDALELGTGTGETARRILRAHRSARLVGIDASADMLAAAREALPAERVELHVRRLQDPLPTGPFDLVVSALAIHHLQAFEKVGLFRRVAAVLRAAATFVLADVVVPDRSEDAVVPIEEGFDLPDRLVDQLGWLEDAGLAPHVTWAWKDLAVIRAQARP